MQRTKETKPRWRKTGGGEFRLGGRTIKSGEVFRAKPRQIPKAFRDVIIPLDNIEEPAPEPKSAFAVKSRGGGWYDVVNQETGHRMNDNALREDQAKELADKMEFGLTPPNEEPGEEEEPDE